MKTKVAGVEKPTPACRGRDPEIWFPLPSSDVAILAKAICDGCPVRAACLEWATSRGIRHGIWGGRSMESWKR